jgi:hypothetical protein
MLSITQPVLRVSLTSELSAHEHNVTIVTVHYFAKNGIAEDNKLLQIIGKIWRNQKSDTWQTNAAGLVTVVRHREHPVNEKTSVIPEVDCTNT